MKLQKANPKANFISVICQDFFLSIMKFNREINWKRQLRRIYLQYQSDRSFVQSTTILKINSYMVVCQGLFNLFNEKYSNYFLFS